MADALRGNAMRTIRIVSLAWFLVLFGHAAASIAQDALPKDLWDRVEHHYADSNGVKITFEAGVARIPDVPSVGV
jgi:hypothetical protein